MSTKPKQKITTVIRKIFRPSTEQEEASSSSSSPPGKLLNLHHRPDAVNPANGPIAEKPDGTHAERPSFLKTKKSTKVRDRSCENIELPSDTRN